jgi:chemotaxis protein MotB
LVVLAISLAGCSYNKLKRENAELKDQVGKLNEALAAAEGEKSLLAQDKAGVEGELERIRAQQQQLEDAMAKLRGEGFDVRGGEGMLVVTLPSKVLYPSGSAGLSSGGKDKLKTLSKTINETLAGFPIEVQGHTDTDPIRLTKDKYASNWELSYDRAQTVVYYLIKSCGVDAKRVHASAYGEYKPMASNATADGKAKNRRVEIVVMRPTGQ